MSNSRTRRPGAGLSAQAASSPALQLFVRRLPAKRFALSASSPRACGEQDARLRRASRAPCLFLPRVSHARGWFRVRAHTGLLFSRAGRNPTSCSLRPGKSPRLRRASRAAAPGKSRTLFFPFPRLARTRLILGAGPRTTSVFPGRQESVLAYSLAPVFLDITGFLGPALKCCPSI